MDPSAQIPVFTLFGETADFPDVLHCERIRDRAPLHDWRIAAHTHAEMMQILHLERGQARVEIEGRQFALKDGEALYVPAQIVHGFAFRQGAEGVVISLPRRLVAGLPALSEALALRLRRPATARVDGRLHGLLLALVDTYAGDGTFRASLLTALGQSLLVAMAELAACAAGADAPPHQHRIAALQRLLRQHLTLSWGARDYAAALGMTPGHLNRICRAATAKSASSYIETARMTEASRLLAFTQLSIAEIGYRLGYEDPPYFSRRFRFVLGETPTAYRARFHASAE